MLFAVSVLLLGGFADPVPPVAQAQELIAQSRVLQILNAPSENSQQLNQLLEEGRKLVDSGNFADAIIRYQEAAGLEQNNPRIFSGIGYLEARQGNFLAAMEAYRKAIALAPNNADFHYALGYVMGNLGDNTGAATAYRHAIEVNRKHMNAYLGLGVVLLRQGKYSDALWAYQKAVSLNPNSARAYELKGAILERQGRFKEAIAAVSHARNLYKHQGQTQGVERSEASLRELQMKKPESRDAGTVKKRKRSVHR